jgi:UDP-N-acetylmuramate--alanine ligase
MTMGAGDVSMVGPEVLAALTARASGRDERVGSGGEGRADDATGADR